MADAKISALTALASGHATGDLIPIVDVSDTTQAASGTTKKTTFQALMQNLPDGLVGTPALSFASDPNTGIYRIGSDNLGIVVSGFAALNVAATGTTFGAALMGGGNTTSGLRDFVLARTSDLTLSGSSDSTKFYTNTGASGEVILTLPSASTTGYRFSFAVDAAQYLRVKAAGTDTIRDAATVSAAAGYIRANVAGNVLEVTCIASGKWYVTSKIGTWTVDS